MSPITVCQECSQRPPVTGADCCELCAETDDDRLVWPHVEKPYPRQVDAVDSAERHLAQSGSTLLVIPTGGGKTLVFAELTRRYVEERSERVLVIAHTEELIDQAVDKVTQFGFGGDGRYIGVEKAERSVDLDGLWAPRVVVASVQSMSQRNRLARFPADTFGLVVIDEAHRSVATSYRAVSDYFRGTVRDDDGVVQAHVERTHLLGVTATPDRRDSRALGDIFETVAYQCEIRDMIREGHLVPIIGTTGVLPHIDLSGVKMTAGDFNQGDLDEAVEVMLGEAADALAKRIEDRQTIAFLPSVDSAILFADTLNGIGLKAASVSGRDHKIDRQNVVEAFRDGEYQILCCCMIGTEGFDVPEISCVAVLRPTTSRALYSQMIGRGTRLAPWIGKEDCLVIDFPGVGFTGKKGHKLENPINALAGVTDEDILRRAQEKADAADKPTSLLDLIEDASAEIEEERAEKARQVKARRAKQELQLDLLGTPEKDRPKWWLELRDVWGLHDGTKPRTKNEIPNDEARAKAILKACKERRKAGLCTWSQARLLRRNKLPATRVPKWLASDWISAIAANNWRGVPASVKAAATEYWEGDSRA